MFVVGSALQDHMAFDGGIISFVVVGDFVGMQDECPVVNLSLAVQLEDRAVFLLGQGCNCNRFVIESGRSGGHIRRDLRRVRLAGRRKQLAGN